MRFLKSKIFTGVLIGLISLYLIFVFAVLNYSSLGFLLIDLDDVFTHEKKESYNLDRIIPQRMIYEYILCCRKIDKNDAFMSNDGEFINSLIVMDMPIKQKEALFDSFVKKGLNINAAHVVSAGYKYPPLLGVILSYQNNNNAKEFLQFLLNRGVIDVSVQRGPKQFTALEFAKSLNKKEPNITLQQMIKILEQAKVKQNANR